jgi:hypothetical protein
MMEETVRSTRNWNAQHALLRRLVEVDQDYSHALETFLSLHATVHTAELHPSDHGSIQDEVLSGLSPAQMRLIPEGSEHSAVWALWHITRIEDVTMNILLADTAQLFHTGGWQDKLGTPWENVGNEMSPEDIGRLSETIILEALLSYRLAVGKRTQAILRDVNFAGLREPPAPERIKRIAVESAVGEGGRWLLEYWGGRPGLNLLLMPATRHLFVHLNEIRRMLPKIKRSGHPHIKGE